MNSHTQVQIFSATKEVVFSFLSDIQNLPKRATRFAKELKEVDGEYKVVTPQGEIFFRMELDTKTGVIDMYGGPTKEHMAYFPSRVIAMPGGNSAYVFTNFQWPDIQDEVFAAQNKTLIEEFENIREHVEVK
jgi:hypothetical protein